MSDPDIYSVSQREQEQATSSQNPLYESMISEQQRRDKEKELEHKGRMDRIKVRNAQKLFVTRWGIYLVGLAYMASITIPIMVNANKIDATWGQALGVIGSTVLLILYLLGRDSSDSSGGAGGTGI